MNETSTNTIPEAAVLDVVAEVLSTLVEDGSANVDIAQITGDDDPKIQLSLTSNWGSPDNLHLTLWDEDDESGPSELGTFALTIRQVI